MDMQYFFHLFSIFSAMCRTQKNGFVDPRALHVRYMQKKVELRPTDRLVLLSCILEAAKSFERLRARIL